MKIYSLPWGRAKISREVTYKWQGGESDLIDWPQALYIKIGKAYTEEESWFLLGEASFSPPSLLCPCFLSLVLLVPFLCFLCWDGVRLVRAVAWPVYIYWPLCLFSNLVCCPCLSSWPSAWHRGVSCSLLKLAPFLLLPGEYLTPADGLLVWEFSHVSDTAHKDGKWAFFSTLFSIPPFLTPKKSFQVSNLNSAIPKDFLHFYFSLLFIFGWNFWNSSSKPYGCGCTRDIM